MAGTSASIEKYVRAAHKENAALTPRWSKVTGHLRYGLAAPIATSAVLHKPFEPPSHYVDDQGKTHRKPIRAFYGLGDGARDRFQRDEASYAAYAARTKAALEAENAAISLWSARARQGEADAVAWYCRTVLPIALPQIPPGSATQYLATAYSASEKHLVVERYLPGIAVVPTVYRYDVTRTVPRPIDAPLADRRAYYLQLLAQVALLTIDRVYRTEIAPAIQTVTMNGISVMRNPATGHQDVVHLISVTIPQASFVTLNLLGVDPIACVAQFNARVTAHPGEYSPITPWVVANVGDVIATVSDTPILVMDPGEFEQLITELLRRMGLRAQRTGRSGDGGVDCEAYDDRPVVGGKVIVQVKRYGNTVPPAVVRDLFGTVHATGATKGVLVTTSGFGPEARAFAAGKPLELIDGLALNALLRQYDLYRDRSEAPEESPTPESQPGMPPISPDGRYYWDGTAWRQIVGLPN